MVETICRVDMTLLRCPHFAGSVLDSIWIVLESHISLSFVIRVRQFSCPHHVSVSLPPLDSERLVSVARSVGWGLDPVRLTAANYAAGTPS